MPHRSLAALLVLLLPTLALGAVPDRPVCATHLQLDRHSGSQLVVPTDSPRGSLELRDAWGEPPNVLLSDRFALKWGSDRFVSDDLAQSLIDLMEHAREVEVLETGLTDPTGWDNTYFNVYIGDSGPEVPSAQGAGGYYHWDDDGFPYIVLGLGTLDDPSWARTVTSHEFFHAVQGASFGYTDWELAYWFWEATATWAASALWPEDWAFSAFLGSYASSPYFRLGATDWEEIPGMPPARQYGAFIFPRFLTELLGEEDVIYEAWGIAEPGSDPLTDLGELLGAERVADSFADMAAANITWEAYEHGGLYAEMDNSFPDVWGWPDQSLVELEEEGDWLVVPEAFEPGVFSYNHHRLSEEAVEAGVFTLRFDGDGSAENWRLRVVAELPSGSEVLAVEPSLDGVEVELPEATYRAWLAVVSVHRGSLHARHSWALQVEPFEEPAGDDDDAVGDDDDAVGDDDDAEPVGAGQLLSGSGNAGCSCSSSGGRSSFPLFGLVLLLGLLRRRPGRS